MCLKPHTAIWFSRLEALSPLQAAMVRAAVDVGGDEACSLCADTPAADMVLDNPEPPPAGARQRDIDAIDRMFGDAPTLRLCADCVRLRATMFGERYVALPEAQSR